MKCMQVKNAPEGEWEFFYDQIEGFTYEPGFEYELRVNKVEVANPPADGSSLRYELVAVVNKTAVSTPTADTLAGTNWVLQGYGSVDSIMVPVAEATIEFREDGTMGGSTGCNSFGGSYTLLPDGGLSLGEMAATMMACADDGVMAQETAVFQALSTVTRYTQTADSLTLAYEGGTMQFGLVQPAEAQSLEGPTWQLTTLVTGESASSLLLDSQITAVFDGQQVTGSAGCNQYFGSYTHDGDTLSFGPLGSTKMACSPELMQQETDFLAALATVQAVVVDGYQLTLTYPQGTLIFTAELVDATEPPREEVSWEEALVLLNSGEVEGVFQTHALDVELQLKDGRWLHTVEPTIDAIFTAVDECGEPCAGIVLATE
jgi:heat shock protein HslJ